MATATLSQTIAEALAADIIGGKLPPGSRLDEVSLSARFGVSRTPVRDALRELVATRLIAYVPRRGFSVSHVDRDRLRDMHEGLGELEALCAGLCALRARSTDRCELELIHERAKAAAAASDAQAYAGANDDFHMALYAGAHSATLGGIALDVRQRLAPFRSRVFFQPDRIRSSLDEHDAVLRAIFAQDTRAAASAMRLHAARTAINVMSLLAAERGNDGNDAGTADARGKSKGGPGKGGPG